MAFLFRFPAGRTRQPRRPARGATTSAPEAIIDRPDTGEGHLVDGTQSGPVITGTADADRESLAHVLTGPGAGPGIPTDAASSPLARAQVSVEHGADITLPQIESNITAGDSVMQDDPIGGQPPDDTPSPRSINPRPAHDGEVAPAEYPLLSF